MPETLDVNQQNAQTSEIDVAGSSRLAVFAKPLSGVIKRVMLNIQISPDGVGWYNYTEFNPARYQVFDVLGHSVRLRVTETASQPAEIELFFVTG